MAALEGTTFDISCTLDYFRLVEVERQTDHPVPVSPPWWSGN